MPVGRSLQGDTGQGWLALGVAGERPAADWLDVLPPQADVLRGYQRELLTRMASALRAGERRILAQAPTGAGKTHVIATLVAAAVLASLRVLILATRTRLVRQLHERLEQFEIAHGVLAASLPGMTNWYAPVQVASVDTLYRRCIVDGRMPLPAADVVVFDEAHLALGESRAKVIGMYPDAWLFGFTATPAMTSGRALSEQFDRLILGPSVRELIDAGMLVKPRIFNQPVMGSDELNAVRKDSKTGDYAIGELSALMSRPKLIGDVVQNWLRIANGKRTLVFACDKKHGADLLTEFRKVGVPAEMLTDQDDEETREQTIARLERGETQVVINCFLLSYGIDIPLVDCVVLARPTRSVVLWLQAVGRGMRPAPGKDSVIVIDHGRVVENLGLPTDDYGWTLHGANVNVRAREKLAVKRREGIEKPRTCPECSAVWMVSEEGNACPNCGWTPVSRRLGVQVQDAELTELTPQQEAWLGALAVETFFREACDWYRNRWPDRWKEREKSGRWWAWMQTRQKFGKAEDERMPSRFWSVPPVGVSDVTAGWLRSQQIRWAKRRAREQVALI